NRSTGYNLPAEHCQQVAHLVDALGRVNDCVCSSEHALHNLHLLTGLETQAVVAHLVERALFLGFLDLTDVLTGNRYRLALRVTQGARLGHSVAAFERAPPEVFRRREYVAHEKRKRLGDPCLGAMVPELVAVLRQVDCEADPLHLGQRKIFGSGLRLDSIPGRGLLFLSVGQAALLSMMSWARDEVVVPEVE